MKSYSCVKKHTLSFILILSVIVAAGQYNVPGPIRDFRCNHSRAAENSQFLSNYFPGAFSWYEDYDVNFYFLDLQVENNTIDLAGNVTTKAKALHELDTVRFELYSGLIIDSVFINGEVRNFSSENDIIKIPVVTPITQGNHFTTRIRYHGTPPAGGDYTGVTTAYNETYQKNVTWTLSEPYAAKDWFPVKQDLKDKADSVWVFLTTSAENKAGSQGLLTAVVPLQNGKVRYEWKSNYPIDYYLISYSVADYMEYNLYAHPEGTADSVFIQNFIYDDPACLANLKAGIDRTADFMGLFTSFFGTYPFIEEKYGHCQAEFGGGMEHQTMTTLGTFSFTVVSHELGHSWFGDKVTCATWNDIWINEGFATYCDYLAHSYLADPIYDSIWLQLRHDYVKTEPGGSVYVPEDQLGDINRIFDGRLSYSKGALLLHMIRFEIQDDELFFNTLKTYVDEFADSVATGEDFKRWLELKTGIDFTDFFTQWYYGEGYPIFDISWNQEENQLNIISTQTTSSTVTPLFKMHLPYYLKFTDGSDTTLILYHDANQNSYAVPLTKTIEEIVLDPDQWTLHGLKNLSVEERKMDSPVYFSFGPNPAGNRMKIYFTQKHIKARMSITDLSGRLLLTREIEGPQVEEDISAIPAGLYFITINDGENELSKRLIKE